MSRKELKFCPYCGGRFERKHVQGRKRLVCTGCGEIYYQNPFPAATALVLNQHNQLLLGKRAVEPAKGEWGLPGGFIEMGESMEQAALRELKEETGLEGKVLSFVGCFFQESLFYGSIIIFGYRIEAAGGTLQAGDDVAEISYFDLGSLPPVAFEAHRKLIANFQKQLKEYKS